MAGRSPLVALTAGLIVFLAALTLLGSGPPESVGVTSTTFPDLTLPDPDLPTERVERVDITTTPISAQELSGISGLTGVLVAVTDDSIISAIDVADGAQRSRWIPAPVTEVRLDATGELARLSSSTTDRIVDVSDLDAPVLLPRTLGSLVWSGDEPRTAAWVEPSGATTLVTFDDLRLTRLEDLGPVDGPIVGLTSAGIWARTDDPATPRIGQIRFVSRTEDTSWRAAGDVFVAPPTGTRGLLARLDISSWRWNFGLNADGIVPLATAPGDASAPHGFVAFDPSGDRLAFIGQTPDGGGWLEIHDTRTTQATGFRLSHPGLDVSWSADGRFVVLASGIWGIQIVDLGEPSVYLLDLGGVVTHAHLASGGAVRVAATTGPAGA